MPAMKDSDFLDLLVTTLANFEKPTFAQIATTLNKYPVIRRMLKKNRVKKDSGHSIQWRVMTGTSGNARMTGLFDTDALVRKNVWTYATIPWRHAETGALYERRESLMNKGAAKLVDQVKELDFQAMIDMAYLLEQQVWQAASVPASDEKSMFGIKCWITKGTGTPTNTANGEGDFSSGLPSGGATYVGGIDPTTPKYSGWQNARAAYTNVTDDDFIKKLEWCYDHTGFESPVDKEDAIHGRGEQFVMYTCYPVIQDLRRLARQQNDQLQGELAMFHDEATFKRNRFQWVPSLDGTIDAQDAIDLPLYGIDHNQFKFVVLDGDYMRRSEPRIKDGSHNTYEWFIDLTANLRLFQRRSCFLLYNAAGAA